MTGAPPVDLALAWAATRPERRSRHRRITTPAATAAEPGMQPGGDEKTLTRHG